MLGKMYKDRLLGNVCCKASVSFRKQGHCIVGNMNFIFCCWFEVGILASLVTSSCTVTWEALVLDDAFSAVFTRIWPYSFLYLLNKKAHASVKCVGGEKLWQIHKRYQGALPKFIQNKYSLVTRDEAVRKTWSTPETAYEWSLVPR